MGIIIAIALVAAATLGGGAWLTGHNSGVDSGKAAQLREDQPKLDKADEDVRALKRKNGQLEDERAAVKEDIRACNQATAAAKADTGIAVAMMAKLGDESRDRVKQFGDMQRRFEAAARTQTPVAKDLSCEAARATLAEYSGQAHILDALGLGGKVVTTPLPSQPALSIGTEPSKPPPKRKWWGGKQPEPTK